jgi:hypothetical protein
MAQLLAGEGCDPLDGQLGMVRCSLFVRRPIARLVSEPVRLPGELDRDQLTGDRQKAVSVDRVQPN